MTFWDIAIVAFVVILCNLLFQIPRAYLEMWWHKFKMWRRGREFSDAEIRKIVKGVEDDEEQCG